MIAATTSGLNAAQLFDQVNSHQKSGDFRAALALLSQLIRAYPKIAALRLKQGSVFWSAREFQQALESFNQAIALDPANPEAYFCRATAQQSLGEDAAALAGYDDALAIRPGYVEALNNKAVLLKEAGRIEDAIQAYNSAIAERPDCVQAWVGKSLCELLLGDFDSGWRSYEWRKRRFGPWGQQPKAAAWQGEDLQGKTLLIQAEQGLGDTIQFCRYAKHAKALGGQVILQVQDRLIRLISTLDPDVKIMGATELPPACDYHVMLLSLPRILAAPEAGTGEKAYLAADPKQTALWRDRLGRTGFEVGIHWQGERTWEGIDKTSDKERSFPLRLFNRISQIPGVRLISLQKNDGMQQLKQLPLGMKVELPAHDFDEGPDAFIDSAAIIANLDLIITSDTAMAHLAGSIGRPVWVALQYIPDWRWQLGRTDTIWYPTAKLFRQASRGAWESVFEEIERELKIVVTANE